MCYFQFFKPLNPVNVVIHYNNDGRASGEADVDFATHEEAQQGMTKDRASMSMFVIMDMFTILKNFSKCQFNDCVLKRGNLTFETHAVETDQISYNTTQLCI